MNENYERYLKQNKGFWFASNDEMNFWAKENPRLKTLKKFLSELNLPIINCEYWYVPSTLKNIEELLIYFSNDALNLFKKEIK